MLAIIVAGLSAWIVFDTSKRPEQLFSGLGYLVFIFCLFITSKYPDRVSAGDQPCLCQMCPLAKFRQCTGVTFTCSLGSFLRTLACGNSHARFPAEKTAQLSCCSFAKAEKDFAVVA